MNQIMVNAVEFDALLKEVEYLKAENKKLEEQLKDAQGRIRVLKEEVGFAERGYTKKQWVGLTDEDFYKKDDETVFVLGMKFAEARLKEKNT
jgi:predicted RNase H-like nuclease (RuvC/YqgF family)